MNFIADYSRVSDFIDILKRISDRQKAEILIQLECESDYPGACFE